MQRQRIVLSTLVALAVLSLTASPASAAVLEPLGAGSDLFTTPGDGDTFVNFFREPLPAGFFCEGSEPFSGMVTLRGVPLVTSPDGSLGNTDTVVQRLDDAVFDQDGMATTRIRLVALSLESVDAIHTNCGDFRLRVTPADGPQPLTTMQIFRSHEYGGFFLAPLQMNVQLTFEPLSRRGGEPIVLVKQVDFPAINKDHKWAYQAAAPNSLSRPGMLAVQSGRPGDTGFLNLPGTSNFAALWGVSEREAEAGVSIKDIKVMPAVTGHIEAGHFVAPAVGD